MTAPLTTLVIPTVGRPSLLALLRALTGQEHPVDAPVIVVDDRPEEHHLAAELAGGLGDHDLDITVRRSGGGGPARARNIGWRHARTRWVSFLDDDVLTPPDWYGALLDDLHAADEHDAVASKARVRVPLPTDRRPTDWERGTAGLEGAQWITADMSVRRDRLGAVGGFDERFPRAFREDADLALRLGAERGVVRDGARTIVHPVRPSDTWASVRQQAGNADDPLMRRLHGPDWHRRARADRGRIRRHAAITGAGLLAGAAVLGGHRRTAALAATAWALGTAELAWARIAPGPRDRDEVRRMVLTSAAIPPVACYHAVRGALLHRHAGPWRGVPDLVLLDRDGTLVHDVPYNGDPDRVRPVDGAREHLDRLRAEGVRVAVVTNQSGVARGLLDRSQVDAVNERVERLLGPFEGFFVCPHGPDDGCRCRKPAPGMVKQACAELGVDPDRCALIGDIGSDVEAAVSAGASAVLVPTPETRREEVAASPRVAADLGGAVDLLLGGRW